MGKLILLVEDDGDIRETVSDLLEGEGYDVVTAENGQIAMDLLQSSSILPSLIVLDLMMPKKDGLQFRAEQVLIPRIAKIPVVIMSADRQIQEKHQETNTVAFLKKPVDIEDLLTTISKFCG